DLDEVARAANRFVLPLTLSIVLRPTQARLLRAMKLESLAVLEVNGIELADALELSARTRVLHVSGERAPQGRAADFWLEQTPQGRKAFVNLGMAGTSRAEIMLLLETTDWSGWAAVTVYARELRG